MTLVDALKEDHLDELKAALMNDRIKLTYVCHAVSSC